MGSVSNHSDCRPLRDTTTPPIGTLQECRYVCVDGGDRGSSRPRLNVAQTSRLTQSGCRPSRPFAMQQTDVVWAENWYSREALVSIVGPTVSVILPALAAELVRRPVTVLVGTTTLAALPAKAPTTKPYGVDRLIYRVATLMCSRKSRAVGLKVRFRRVATATVNCCVPRATGSALSDQRLAF
jgi:hypothetical protein